MPPDTTLPDPSRLPSVNGAGAQANKVINEVRHSITLCWNHHTETPQLNNSVIIDGVFNDDGLTVFLRSPDSGCMHLKIFCVRFEARELTKIAGFPDRTDRFCDISTGVTSEGLTLVIESHRCYEADPQGNALTLKV